MRHIEAHLRLDQQTGAGVDIVRLFGKAGPR